jgi:protein-S-isoprenylcysteine O-methyltransferase Ste14
MYVAELGLWLGWALFFGSPGVLIGFVVLLSVVSLVILPREERGLEAAFGQAYLQYKDRVPRWLGKANH